MKQRFSEEVYRIVRRIPEGKVATYGQIAAQLRKPKAAWAVGNALHKNPFKSVPCHRVVNQEGRVAPNFGNRGWREQKRKLRLEGVIFKDKMHVDLKSQKWNL